MQAASTPTKPTAKVGAKAAAASSPGKPGASAKKPAAKGSPMKKPAAAMSEAYRAELRLKEVREKVQRDLHKDYDGCINLTPNGMGLRNSLLLVLNGWWLQSFGPDRLTRDEYDGKDCMPTEPVDVEPHDQGTVPEGNGEAVETGTEVSDEGAAEGDGQAHDVTADGATCDAQAETGGDQVQEEEQVEYEEQTSGASWHTRVVVVFGQNKNGKTFVCSRLADRPEIATRGDNVHTPGLCQLLSGPDGDKDLKSRRFLILDSVGAERAVYAKYRKDELAADDLLREFCLKAAGTSVFVVTKYTVTTQTTIDSLLLSLGAKIKNNNRLIVLHNLVNTNGCNEEDGIAKITKHAHHLFETHNQDWTGKWIGPGEAPPDELLMEHPLQPNSNDALVRKIKYYETPNVRHYFIVWEDQQDPNHWSRKWNAEVFQALKLALLAGVQVVRDFNLIREFCSQAAPSLRKYIANLPPVYRLAPSEDGTKIQLEVPVKEAVAPSLDDNGFTVRDEDQLYKQVTEWRVRKPEEGDLKLHEMIILSDGRTAAGNCLYGDSDLYEKEGIMRVEVPGLPDDKEGLDNIKICYRLDHGSMTYGIVATLPPARQGMPSAESGGLKTHLLNDARHGTCSWSCAFPRDVLFEPIDRARDVSLKSGVLTIRLRRDKRTSNGA